MASNVEKEDFVRNIKGAAASILWILYLTGRSLSNQTLQQATGYSGKPVARALAWLQPRGYVQFNGRLLGWSLGKNFQQFMPAFQMDDTGQRPFPVTAANEVAAPPTAFQQANDTGRFSGRRNFTADQNNSTLRRNSSPGKNEPLFADVDLNLREEKQEREREEQQQQTAKKEEPGIHGEKGQPVAALLDHIGIHGRARNQLLQRRDLEPAAVKAWWWYALTQQWLDNPAGFVICRLKDHHHPPDGYLELARAWDGLEAEERDELHVAATGSDQGLVHHERSENGRELRSWLGDERCPELNEAALDTYLELLSQAPHVLAEL